MNLLTHILLSKIILKNYKGRIPLNSLNIQYGSIKPDLSFECMKQPHLIDIQLEKLCKNLEDLIKDSSSIDECSLALGVAIHYICDFFCKYHVNDQISNKLVQHFFYELILQFSLFKMMLQRKILTLSSARNSFSTNIAQVILDMKNDYLAKTSSPQNDINYALLTASHVCYLVTDQISLTCEEEANGYITIREQAYQLKF